MSQKFWDEFLENGVLYSLNIRTHKFKYEKNILFCMEKEKNHTVAEQILNQTFKELIIEDEFNEDLIMKLNKLYETGELGNTHKIQEVLSLQIEKKNEIN